MLYNYLISLHHSNIIAILREDNGTTIALFIYQWRSHMNKLFYDDTNTLKKYLKDVQCYDVLESNEQLILVAKAQKGDTKARNLLISTNLRFVIEAIKHYKNSTVSFHELISEGNLGLCEAIDKFDVTRQNNFISYAVWWIRYYVIRAIQKYGNLVRIPLNKKREIMEVKKIEQENHIKGENNPKAILKQIKNAMHISEKYVSQLQNLSRYVDSLHKNLEMADENSGTYEDILVDTNAEDPYLFTLRNAEDEVLTYFLENIPAREAEIIKKRYGIAGVPVRSLKQLSIEYKLTKERIRQLESRGICRMKSIAEEMRHSLHDVA